VFAVVAVAAGCDLDAAGGAPTPAATPPRAQVAAAAQRARDDCRDTCEQTAILAHGSDEDLRACRARCDGSYAVTAPPHEVPSRITRAPATHAPLAVRPR
jgi:hypothetical protein